MKPLHRQILRLAFAVAVLVVASWALISYFSEPRYKGRRLTSWLREYDQNMWDESESARAIRAMGTNAAPALARMVIARESFSLERVAKKLRLPIELLPSSEPMENHRLAMHGFRLLGPTASNALPLLLKTFEEPHRMYYVYEALQTIGEPALPALNQFLTSTNAETQRYAVFAILNMKPDRVTLSNLLAHPEPGVRGETYLSVHTRRDLSPEEKLQILLRGISDPHTYASQRAVLGLRPLGLYATNALPALYQHKSTTNALLAREVTTTIGHIEKRVRIEQSSVKR